MKTIRDFLTDLRRQQVDLWVDGDQLRLKAPKGVLTERIMEQIQERKPEILLFLKRDVKETERPPMESVPRTEGAQLPAAKWNDTVADYPKDKCIHQLFEEQVERTPDAVALVFVAEEQKSKGARLGTSNAATLTYRELNDRANQLAHYLRTLGIGAESIVGICVERSLEMVVSILGILKAGGVYLPLDPAYPQERLAFMLRDAQPHAVVTQQRVSILSLAMSGEGKRGAQVVNWDTGEAVISAQPTHNPSTEVLPQNLTYVIYTSGSTGQPKGVLLEHRGLCNVSQAQARLFGLTSTDRVLQFSSLNFDAATFEIWMALTVGASLYVGTYEVLAPGEPLQHFLAHHHISMVTLTPSTLAVVPLTDLPALHTIAVAGEACPAELMAQWGRGRRFFNLYGPTEATIWATALLCNPEARVKAAGRPEAPSIGCPIDNTQLYILDRHGHLTPVGAAGELHIGGLGVARGYLNRPELTKEKFIDNPFGPGADGARLYRTGDLCRWLPDGTIEFLGRIDHQVKIRGFRIELGEIEAALTSHAVIHQAVVIAREDQPGDKRLTAYVVPANMHSATENQEMAWRALVSQLRSNLQEKLPHYMVPSAFVWLETLPLTPNGKVDRKALPAPVDVDQDVEYVSPRNDIEHELVAIWQQALNTKRVGIYDDFFAMGGDSLKAGLVVNQLQERFNGIFHAVMLFEVPTVAACAAYLQREYPELIVASTQPAQVKVANGAALAAITPASAAQLRHLLPVLPPRPDANHTKNPPAIFVLSPPRSGSTLLRVMLAGHPQRFAPPELHLLSFNTLDERSAAFSGPYTSWGEGAIHALRQIEHSSTEGAQYLMQELEQKELTTQAFFYWLQKRLGERKLVDKTSTYALDSETLKRAEMDFEQPLYIHLLRHPYGMIRSFEEAKLDQILYSLIPTLRGVDRMLFSRRQLAELVWLISHQNILTFLADIPAQRQYQIKFEELIKEPESHVCGLCNFLQLNFDARMLEPYADRQERMTDGLHSMSRMMGDPKFHQHHSIDATVADQWQQAYQDDFLMEETWRLTDSLGYIRPQVPLKREELAYEEGDL